MQCSYFLRWLVVVILNLHNFMLSTKQNITYQYELVKIRGYFYLFQSTIGTKKKNLPSKYSSYVLLSQAYIPEARFFLSMLFYL